MGVVTHTYTSAVTVVTAIACAVQQALGNVFVARTFPRTSDTAHYVLCDGKLYDLRVCDLYHYYYHLLDVVSARDYYCTVLCVVTTASVPALLCSIENREIYFNKNVCYNSLAVKQPNKPFPKTTLDCLLILYYRYYYCYCFQP